MTAARRQSATTEHVAQIASARAAETPVSGKNVEIGSPTQAA
jgi:hypothetical protein